MWKVKFSQRLSQDSSNNLGRVEKLDQESFTSFLHYGIQLYTGHIILDDSFFIFFSEMRMKKYFLLLGLSDLLIV